MTKLRLTEQETEKEFHSIIVNNLSDVNDFSYSNPHYLRYIKLIHEQQNLSQIYEYNLNHIDDNLCHIVSGLAGRNMGINEKIDLRQSEEYFIFWFIQLIKDYHLHIPERFSLLSDDAAIDIAQKIIAERNLNIYDVSFIHCYYGSCFTSSILSHITYAAFRILNCYSNMIDGKEFPLISNEMIKKYCQYENGQRINQFNHRYFSHFYCYEFLEHAEKMKIIVEKSRIENSLKYFLDQCFFQWNVNRPSLINYDVNDYILYLK